ncbi:hypothetical protein C8J56DRAFT_1047899 [Mycena floridula]|nr:hypothetical protein C8J56DRAFT_1047899 [Mycena floridula]
MSTDLTGSLDREEREAITSVFVHYAEISNFTKRAANHLSKRFNPNRENHHSKQVLPSEITNEIDEPVYAPASDEDHGMEFQPVIPQTPLDHDGSMRDKFASLAEDKAVEILQELILILEEPFNMSVILEEIKQNMTANHYWTFHCLYIRIIDNHYSKHFQGMNRECYHLDALANVQTQILLRKPILTHNPFITEDEDEFLYYCAKVIDKTSVNLGNTI